MASKSVFPGDFCRRALICEEALLGESDKSLPKLSTPLTKGIAYELNNFRKKYGISWNTFNSWLEQLSLEPLPSLATIRVAISRLEKKRAEFSRNKQPVKIQELLEEPLYRSTNPKNDVHNPLSHNTVVSSTPLKEVNRHLARELTSTQQALKVEVSRTDKLTSKLKEVTIRNINKRIRRRDEKIKSFESEVTSLVAETSCQAKTIDKLQKQLELSKHTSERYRVANYRADKQIESVSCENSDLETRLDLLECNFVEKINSLESEIGSMAHSLETAKIERDSLAERLTELQSTKLPTKKHGQLYLNSVRQCCMELLSRNVGIRQVEPVIRSVLKHIASMEVEDIPKASTLVKMLAEMKGLAYQQLAEELCEDGLTLHTDWFNVSYDGEEEVLSLNLLLDIEKGDLEFVDC